MARKGERGRYLIRDVLWKCHGFLYRLHRARSMGLFFVVSLLALSFTPASWASGAPTHDPFPTQRGDVVRTTVETMRKTTLYPSTAVPPTSSLAGFSWPSWGWGTSSQSTRASESDSAGSTYSSVIRSQQELDSDTLSDYVYSLPIPTPETTNFPTWAPPTLSSSAPSIATTLSYSWSKPRLGWNITIPNRPAPAPSTIYESPATTFVTITVPSPTTLVMDQKDTKPAKITALAEQTTGKVKPSSKTSWHRPLPPSFGIKTSPAAAVPEDNIFVPIQQDYILPQIPVARNHPVPRKGIVDSDNRTLHTNKFYANAFLGNQDMPIWTHPYSVWWGRGQANGQFATWGMSIGHTEEQDIVMPEGDPARYYINAPRRQSLVLTAVEFGDQTTLTTDTHLPLSVNVNLNNGPTAGEPIMTFPLVQGMSFVTAIYRNAMPILQCPGQGFKSISAAIVVGKSVKYRIADADGRSWVAYINPIPTINYDATAFKLIDKTTFLGPPGFVGTIQLAKNPLGDEGERIYDRAAGTFVSEANITATVNNARALYGFSYTKVGVSPLLMFLLPHHIQSLDPSLAAQVTKLQLRTTTKGLATAVWGDSLSFVEPSVPFSMGFAPWSEVPGTKRDFSQPIKDIINAAAEHDLSIIMGGKVPDDSMYYAGKTLSRFATICWVLKEVVNNPIWQTGLDKLKQEMSRYVNNQQRFPLFYDDNWKGLVSNAGFSDPGADFGNTYYNDHHFHYGYFVHAAAVIGSLDPEWVAQGDNKVWVNSLVKDYAESDHNGRDFPFFRSFDWYHGHSWAKGLFESADGKDEESSSEDGFASYAVKMWGKVIGDANMEKRGNLMLAIQARSFRNYFYMTSDNINHPRRFINNSVTGILFENKVDHATYFGTAPEFIHGIHMLPLSPASIYLRSKDFVTQEWNRFFSDNRWKVAGGWRGILMANLALIDPAASWEFFRGGVDGVWDDGWIDNGASRSWYLVMAAGLGDVHR